MNQKIKVILKDETLGFDIGSLLSNPLVSTGMNAILPGSGMVASMLAPSLSKPQKPKTDFSSLLKNYLPKTTVSAPPPRTQSQTVRRTPPPPKPQAPMQARSMEPAQITQAPAPVQKEGIDKNILLIGGIVLAGGAVVFLTNNKGRRK